MPANPFAEIALTLLTAAVDGDVDEEFVVEEIRVGSVPGWAGKSLAALGLPAQFGVTVLAIADAHEQMSAPEPHEPLSADHRLILAGTAASLQQVRRASAVS